MNIELMQKSADKMIAAMNEAVLAEKDPLVKGQVAISLSMQVFLSCVAQVVNKDKRHEFFVNFTNDALRHLDKIGIELVPIKEETPVDAH